MRESAKKFVEELYQQRQQKFSDPEFSNLVDRSVDQVLNCNALFELIQNADDVELGRDNVQVNISLKEMLLTVSHNGKQFSEDDVRGIVRIAYGNKQNDPDSTGFMGIGFKSVYAFSDAVSITSSPYSFSFDKKLFEEKEPDLEEAHSYWYGFPLWQEKDNIPQDEVLFEMHLSSVEKRKQVKDYIKGVIEAPQMLLFLKHITSLTIIDDESKHAIKLEKCGEVVTDYGNFEDLLKYYRAAFFDLPWLEDPQYIVELKNSFDMLSQQSSEEQENFKKEFSKKYCIGWNVDDMQRIFNYFTNTILPRFHKLFSSPLSPFNIAICNRFKNNIKAANQMIRRIILLDIASDINEGTYESLVRPIRSYGSKEEGDTYPRFEKSMECYFSRRNHLIGKTLAVKIRHILRGENVDADLEFLPNLVGAWFIAETVRNPVSLMTGLMLIDMIENSIELNDEKGNNWYLWLNTLIHPQKRHEMNEVRDLYNSRVGIDRFGGSHPMAQGSSVKEASKPLRSNERLSTVRQKEGSLILHWLYERIKREENYNVSLIKVNYNDLTSLPKNQPEYEEIAEIGRSSIKLETINKKIKKLRGTIGAKQKKDSNADVKKESDDITNLNKQKIVLEKKQQLQQELIERLLKSRMSTTENLLFPAEETLAENFTTKPQKILASLLETWVKNKPIIKDFLSLLSNEKNTQMPVEASLQDNEIDELVMQRKEALKTYANKFQYVCHETAGDGNCFFYAIADQLKRLGRTGQDINPDILRILAAIEINQNKVYYNNFIREEERLNFANNIAQCGVWVGLVVAQAIARLKKIIIVIIPNDGGRPQVIKPMGITEVVVLGNEVDIHFQSLTPKLGLGFLPGMATPALQRIIDDTPELAKITHESSVQIAPSKTAPKASFFMELQTKLIRTFVTSSGINIAFNDNNGDIEAEYNEIKINSDHIHVNILDSPEETPPFSKHEFKWQLEVLNKMTDLSLAFPNEIVITKLNDWSFMKKP